MTRRIPFLLAAPAVLALAGCAAGPAAQHDDGVDHARMAQVERAAAKTGVKVLWINAPRKAPPAGG